MKNFKLYVYIGQNKTLVTNSKLLSAAATFEETCSLTENGQVSFSCKIAKNISPNTLNLFYKYFSPGTKLSLELFTFNDKLENIYDLIITQCSPTFYHNNQILSITAVDFASNHFSKLGVNMDFEEVGNIYQLSTQLLAKTNLNPDYTNITNNRFEIGNVKAPYQMFYDNINSLYQKYYYNEEIWLDLCKKGLVSENNIELMNDYLNKIEQDPNNLSLKVKRNSLFSQFYAAEFDQAIWNSWLIDDYVLATDAVQMQTYQKLLDDAAQKSSNCRIVNSTIRFTDPIDNIFDSYFYYETTEKLPSGEYNLKFIAPESVSKYSVSVGEEDKINWIDNHNSKVIKVKFTINEEEFIKMNFHFESTESYITIQDMTIDKDYVPSVVGNSLKYPNQWTVDIKCLEDFVNKDKLKNSSYYTQNTLKLSSSNLYNGLVELALLFDAEINFDYANHVISFINKNNRTYKGIKFDPNYNINSFSRTSDISDFSTVLDIYSTKMSDSTINLIQDIPTELKNYLTSCVDKNFETSSEEEELFVTQYENQKLETDGGTNILSLNGIMVDYFNYYEKGKYSEIVDGILEKLGDNYSGDRDALKEYGIILDQIPNFENRIYNLEYYYNIGVITENQYKNFLNIVNNDLRKINIRLKVMGDQYNSTITTLSFLVSQLDYYATLITTTEREINTTSWEIEDLNKKINDTTGKYSDDFKNKCATDIVGLTKSRATALENLDAYIKELNKIFGIVKTTNTQIETEYPDLINESLYTLLVQLYGYTNATNNGYYKYYKDIQQQIEEKNEELKTKQTRINTIDSMLAQESILNSIQVTLKSEKAGLLADIKAIYHKIGTNSLLVEKYAALYEQAFAKYEECIDSYTNIRTTYADLNKNISLYNSNFDNIEKLYRQYFVLKADNTLYPNWDNKDENSVYGKDYWTFCKNLNSLIPSFTEPTIENYHRYLDTTLGMTVSKDSITIVNEVYPSITQYIIDEALILTSQDDKDEPFKIVKNPSIYKSLDKKKQKSIDAALSSYDRQKVWEYYINNSLDSVIDEYNGIGTSVVDQSIVTDGLFHQEYWDAAAHMQRLIAAADQAMMESYIKNIDIYYAQVIDTVDNTDAIGKIDQNSRVDYCLINITSSIDDGVIDNAIIADSEVDIAKLLLEGNSVNEYSVTSINNSVLTNQNYWNELATSYESFAKEGVYTGSLFHQLNGYGKLLELYQLNTDNNKLVTKGLYNYIDDYQSEDNLYKQKNDILQELRNLYGDYMIEGYYQNDNVISNIELLEQALLIKNEVCYPKINYSIGIIDLSSLENYKFLHIAIGDKIKLADELFLQYNPSYQNYLEITGINYDLRHPESTTLTVDKQKLDNRLIQKLFLNLVSQE